MTKRKRIWVPATKDEKHLFIKMTREEIRDIMDEMAAMLPSIPNDNLARLDRLGRVAVTLNRCINA